MNLLTALGLLIAAAFFIAGFVAYRQGYHNGFLDGAERGPAAARKRATEDDDLAMPRPGAHAFPEVSFQRAGDRVPDWLFHVDPMEPEARPGEFNFMQDCAIFDRAEDYLVVPIERPGDNMLELSSAAHISIRAATKPVLLFNCAAIYGAPGGETIHYRGED